MAEHSIDLPPPDHFKAVHVPLPTKPTGQDPCTEKPNKVTAYINHSDEADF
jgi:hypothetical protein